MSSFKRNFYILLEKLTIRCADIIVAVGHNTIEAYHKENIGKNIPFQVVRSGIDITNYLEQAVQTDEEKLQLKKSLGIKADDIVLITVGRFSHSKAQRYAIEAFASLQKKHTNLKFLLIGEGELLPDCKVLAETLNIPDNSIYFLGYQKDIPKYLSISDLFIFTSLREGLPRVIVEASVLKIPVITFKVEGAEEVLQNEKTGFIVPQGNANALLSKTEELILNPELRLFFGKGAYQFVIQHWDVSIMTEQLHRIYNRNTG